MNNIIGTQGIVRLVGILKLDISALSNLAEKNKDSQEKSNFLDSLVSAKKEILQYLDKVGKGSYDLVSTPRNLEIKSYENYTEELISPNRQLAKIALEIEITQVRFLDNELKMEGISDDVKAQLTPALDIYHQIRDQLHRSVSTDQLGVVVT